MSTITVKDGTTIYYKDWGEGPVVTFSHGWPLNSDAWDGQMLFLKEADYVPIHRRSCCVRHEPAVYRAAATYARTEYDAEHNLCVRGSSIDGL